MLTPFFTQAALSPGRQQSFRRAVVAHVTILVGAIGAVSAAGPGHGAATLLGPVLLVAGIVEGAVLVGWRLTQLPRSQALEFLLVSQLRPSRLFLAETLVGSTRLALVTLSGLPVLTLLVSRGLLLPEMLAPLLLMPVTGGILTGLGLVVWAYEPAGVRRWGERVLLALVLVYLAAGVLGAERLVAWSSQLPAGAHALLTAARDAFFDDNPFAVIRDCHRDGLAATWRAVAGAELVAAALLVLLGARAATRLMSHFHERHYQPAADRAAGARRAVGDRPLAWWAVKRVSHYSGRINVWLAGGFGVLYALYVMAGPLWPDWLGRGVFVLCDQSGGIPAVATGLVLLAAVPAAFQYGLWDSSVQDRCRRLELLLLTRLAAHDYWAAAAAAAWRRGRGYFFVALVLWGAAAWAGRMSPAQTAAALAAGVLLWCLYFALGFRAFSRGAQANGLGLVLTVGLPLVTGLAGRGDFAVLTPLLPPGSVYAAAARAPDLLWALGPAVTAAAAVAIGRFALARCEPDLRRWYETHHGRKVMS
jgi:hypothetical protein